MRTYIAAAALCAVMTSGEIGRANRSAGCSFSLSAEATAPEIVRGTDLPARASVMAQPDSPLAIVRVDFSGMKVTTGGGSFTRTGRHVVDVKNMSDQVLTGARVMVRVGFGASSGIGSGATLGRPLQPGEQARIEWKSGSGQGNSATTDELSIVAMVEEIKTAGCTYHRRHGQRAACPTEAPARMIRPLCPSSPTDEVATPHHTTPHHTTPHHTTPHHTTPQASLPSRSVTAR
jgi:hypothetical protein